MMRKTARYWLALATALALAASSLTALADDKAPSQDKPGAAKEVKKEKAEAKKAAKKKQDKKDEGDSEQPPAEE